MIKIIKLNSVSNNLQFEKIIEQVKNIFYLSSSLQTFSSEERRVAFFKRWCGDYINLFPEQFCIVIEDDGADLRVLGYLSGCHDSHAAALVLEVPGFKIFSDFFAEYPAHFHINFHPDCRGRGLGSLLVENYCKDLYEQKVRGVHIITSTTAANISFYQKLQFTREEQRSSNSMMLLFMGKKLD